MVERQTCCNRVVGSGYGGPTTGIRDAGTGQTRMPGNIHAPLRRQWTTCAARSEALWFAPPSFTASENDSVATPRAKAAGSIGVSLCASAMQRYEKPSLQLFPPQCVAHEHKWLPCTSQSLQRKRVIPAGDAGIAWPSLKKHTRSHGKGTARRTPHSRWSAVCPWRLRRLLQRSLLTQDHMRAAMACCSSPIAFA
jgi:hypothetical protein